MSGKGDKRRPTDEAAYADGWERIWGNPAEALRHLAVEAGHGMDHEAVDEMAAYCECTPSA